MVWLALTVCILAPLLALGYLAAQALGFWRAFRGFTRAFGADMAEVGGRLDALASRDPADLERLGPSLDRLRRSSAQLSLLLNALGRVRDQWSGLLAVYPRK